MTKKLLIGVFSLWLLLTGCTAPSGNNGESRGDPVSIMFLGDTYFGESQCEYILQNELPILKRGENIDSGLLDLIERGCKKVLATSWSYLKITRQS